MKKLIILASALAVCASAFAEGAVEEKKAEPHFKFYGFVRTYVAFDTHESSAGTGDLYYYMPKDRDISPTTGEDLNENPSFRYLSLTSRLGVDVLGYEFGGYKIGGKIEADFYSGLSGSTGTATFRLRQAYVTVGKKSRNWKIGQAWHPMAADLPDIFSLESGAPFGPFSRTPQINFETKLADKLSLTAAAIWQMQYTSTGPSGASADYIKYSLIPEFYLGFNFKWNKNIFRIGGEYLSIKPRNLNLLKTERVSDRLNTFNLFQYGQFGAGNWTIKEKITYANDGSHMNLVGGYGVSKINTDGSWEYSASRNVSGWATVQYKKKDCPWVPSILLGYIKNFGTPEVIIGEFWKKNNADSVNQMFRIQPEILYNLGKLSFGLEYMWTSVNYGKPNEYKLATEDLHWVNNHRIQALVKFTF